MADVVAPAVRSRMMSAIRGRDTKPELYIRRGLFARGFRYTLHRRDLPGKPDIVLPKYGAVILVNGCFWHGHRCALFRWPSTNSGFWRAKILRTRSVDRRAIRALSKNWRVLRVWECALKGSTKLPEKQLIDDIESWLRGSSKTSQISGQHRIKAWV